ncbi:MAG: hypothetical protein NZ870_02485, partial [bacterium]|nr:hypothetical protein [bacterium]
MVDLSYLHHKNEIGLLPASSISFFIASSIEKSAFFFNSIDEITPIEKDLLVLNVEFLKIVETEYESLPYILYRLINEKPNIVIISKKLLLYEIPEINSLKNAKRLSRNSSILITELKNWLSNHGYERYDEATSPYEYAIRGSTVDVYLDKLIRVNFEYNKIISIKEIDPVELIMKEVEDVVLIPKSYNGKLEDYLKGYKIYSEWSVDYKGIKFNVPFINEGIESVFDTDVEKYLKNEYRVFYFTNKKIDCKNKNIKVINGTLSGGFKVNNTVVLTEIKKSDIKLLDIETDFEINRGDYVVHSDYGIAIYKGIVEKDYLNERSDFIVLEFRNKTILYIPIKDISKIKPYRSFLTKRKPRLTKLNSNEWIRKKL